MIFIPRCGHCKNTLPSGGVNCPHCGTPVLRATPKQLLTSVLALVIFGIIVYVFDKLKL